MKSVWISWILLAVVFIFIVLHAFVITDMTKDILKYVDETKAAVSAESWEEASEAMERVKSRWESGGVWAELTIRADRLDDIKISLDRSEVLLSERDKTAFLSEFTRFELLVDDIPDNEGLEFLK